MAHAQESARKDMTKKSNTERYTLADLEKWREARDDVDPPIRLGIFGDPVAHSLSPQIQNAALCACKLAWQCALENCDRLVLVNRTLEKANALVERLQPSFAGPRVLGPVARLEAVPWDEAVLRAHLADIDLLVNATPLGMNPSDLSPVPARLLAPHHMVFDAVYGSSKTSLLRAADEAGARGANGLSMLLNQGALAF